MFDHASGTASGAATPVATLQDWKRQLAGITAGLDDDAQRIDALRAMEELKSALEGEQAALTVDFVVSQRREQTAAGVPARHRGRGIAAQVALARRESGHRGQKHLHLFGADDEPARVRGYGPIPAEIARRLIERAQGKGLAALRRLYTRPGSGQVVGMDSRARLFPAGLADLIGIRDAVHVALPVRRGRGCRYVHRARVSQHLLA